MAGCGWMDGARPTAASIAVLLTMIFATLCRRAQGAGTGACYDPETAGIAPLSTPFQITKELCGDLFDHVVSLHDPLTGKHMCTGSLVAPGVVATTATCLDLFQKHEFPDAKIGGTAPNDAREEQMIETCQKIIHKGYDPRGRGGPDLGLLMLKQKAVQEPIKNMMLLAECPNGNISFIGYFHLSQHLHGVPRLITVPNKDCEGLIGNIHEGSVCAKTDGTANPVYDEGGILLCDGKDLVGFASRTKLGATYNPIAFTEVAPYKEWIDNRGKAHSTVLRNEACDQDL